jgi:hypothetical protein
MPATTPADVEPWRLRQDRASPPIGSPASVRTTGNDHRLRAEPTTDARMNRCFDSYTE